MWESVEAKTASPMTSMKLSSFSVSSCLPMTSPGMCRSNVSSSPATFSLTRSVDSFTSSLVRSEDSVTVCVSTSVVNCWESATARVTFLVCRRRSCVRLDVRLSVVSLSSLRPLWTLMLLNTEHWIRREIFFLRSRSLVFFSDISSLSSCRAVSCLSNRDIIIERSPFLV